MVGLTPYQMYLIDVMKKHPNGKCREASESDGKAVADNGRNINVNDNIAINTEREPQSGKRQRVVTRSKKVHMRGISGFLCGSRSRFWMATNRPITCARCRQILAAEGYYMNNPTWTWRQFDKAMKAAGWQRVPGDSQAKTYEHANGAKFYPLAWTKWRADRYVSGEAWYEYAVLNQVPEPIPF